MPRKTKSEVPISNVLRKWHKATSALLSLLHSSMKLFTGIREFVKTTRLVGSCLTQRQELKTSSLVHNPEQSKDYTGSKLWSFSISNNKVQNRIHFDFFSSTVNAAKVDPSPSGRRPDLTAKGKNELVALFSRKSGVENRGEVKQRCTSTYTIPSQRMFSRSTVPTPHRTQPQPTRLDTCAGNCQ
ncbi:hypothetical protein PHYBLDRAFT_141186 [Phycomyces blakesleeanus NRRL 1555(-)]|uniref:Uncharacterized protein n=1 Tax=Phycomyces blakesleeanus (strain ATCC 8743b / DSM 1359 / FGSC 10004 / NBRC 33097 / NRRL 1555) TaxID=763407 RepID=A0A167P5S4_PHYB8|nr:hypothetical protein PHYBLDRAFT_141186 [Phycomyces blakesleeanus NRRL 1555(-)]OAD77301.1 hypothetical protein PHYBLDRAFT_141186 [Phycomyces blakesleeanus NRRL 1555(-)]|eukprot:XP_018295341.1 hypothetical protein PHYBLDRAFT_141186 [Phycomyces blakesleeanus NRRL 1555(-)]